MRKWIFFLVLFVGCQSTGKLETSVNPTSLEMTEVRVVVEFKSN